MINPSTPLLTTSYNLPSGRVLKKQGTRFSLKIPYSTPLLKADVRELSVRIILPECAKNVRFILPDGVDQPSLDYRWELKIGCHG